MATLRHWGEPAFSAPYEVSFRSQYFLYHLVGAGLTAVVGDADRANRLLLVLAGGGMPLAFRALLRAAGRDERLALFACLPFWSRSLVIGFLPFVASIPLAFYALSLVFRAIRREPTRGRGAFLAFLATLLFYAHVSSWMILVASSIAVAIVARRPRVLTWLLPSVALAGLWFMFGKLTLGNGTLADASEIRRMSVTRSIFALPVWIFDVWRSHGDEVAAATWWCGFLVTVALSARSLGRYSRGALVRLYVPFVCVLLIYLLTPWRVGAAAMLNVRLAPILVLLALLPTRLPHRGLGPTIVIGFVFAANIIGGITAVVECRRANADLGDLDAVVAAMPPGSRSVTLNFDNRSPVTRIFPWTHVGAYHRVRSGGVAEFSFSNVNHWPLHYRAAERPPPKIGARWEPDPCSFRNAIDGNYYDFVLVRGAVDPFANEPSGPVFRRVITTGPMTLFRKESGVWPERTIPDPGPCPAK